MRPANGQISLGQLELRGNIAGRGVLAQHFKRAFGVAHQFAAQCGAIRHARQLRGPFHNHFADHVAQRLGVCVRTPLLTQGDCHRDERDNEHGCHQRGGSKWPATAGGELAHAVPNVSRTCLNGFAVQEAPQVPRHAAGGRVAAFAIFVEGFGDDPIEFGRLQILDAHADRQRRFFANPAEQLRVTGMFERQAF